MNYNTNGDDTFTITMNRNELDQYSNPVKQKEFLMAIEQLCILAIKELAECNRRRKSADRKMIRKLDMYFAKNPDDLITFRDYTQVPAPSEYLTKKSWECLKNDIGTNGYRPPLFTVISIGLDWDMINKAINWREP